jgi:NADPH-dependent 2,4-dienoyl-CoA reductase/sulfur reductase-like enzyme
MFRENITTDILTIGGGPAGLAAAVSAAESGRRVTIVDDNPRLGGQIWRAELGKNKSPDAERLLAAIAAGKFNLINNAQIFAVDADSSLLAETNGGSVRLSYNKLILATGARERFLPFPGWTLPGVLGAGGLQALVKGGFDVAGKRILVAGTGPLLLVVAEYLKSKEAKVVAILEQAPASKINRFALGLWRYPAKIAQGFELRSRLAGIPYLKSSWIKRVERNGQGLNATVNKNGRDRQLECEYIACGFHLVPNIELPSILGCSIVDGFVTVDNYQRTSVPNIFTAGEPTGIGGVEAAFLEGKIAGFAATGETRKAEALLAKRDRTDRFATALNAAFELRDELKDLAIAETLVCRCEDVSFEKLRTFDNWREAKLQTRCGMGPCQGRVCGPATEFLFGWQRGSVRPPIFPVKLENL